MTSERSEGDAKRERDEADRWFVRRLDPKMRQSEREAFERWRAEDPSRTKRYAETERLWDRLHILKSSARLQRHIPTDPAHARHRWRKLPYPILWGAAASLALIVVLFMHRPDADTAAQTMATALGEQRIERLSDGTTVRLNTESTIEVRMRRKDREITLKGGEAVFEVAKDATRPFIVTAGDGTVTALGTEFQVRNEGGTVAVTLIEGRVQVAKTSIHLVESLSPGQQATYSPDTKDIVTRNVDVAAATSWTSGRLDFRGTPLEVAVAEANRYSARKIRIGDPAIRDMPVSGTFRTGDVDGMAAAFEAAFGLHAKNAGTEWVLYGKER